MEPRAIDSLLRVWFRVPVDDMPFVSARILLRLREWHDFFDRQHGIATHVILEAGRRKHEHHAGCLGPLVLHTYPGPRWNEHGSSRVKIAFLVSQMNVHGSSYDIQNFILSKVFVCRKFVPWIDILGSHNKVLRAVVLGADLQDEVTRRRLTPNPALALVLLEQERSWRSDGRGCGTGMHRPRVKEANRKEDYGQCHERRAN